MNGGVSRYDVYSLWGLEADYCFRLRSELSLIFRLH